MGNPENHHLEIAGFNALMKPFGMQFVNRYPSARKLELPRSLPIIGGLCWAYYIGNLVSVDRGDAANPRGRGGQRSPQEKPAKGTRDEDAVSLARAASWQ